MMCVARSPSPRRKVLASSDRFPAASFFGAAAVLYCRGDSITAGVHVRQPWTGQLKHLLDRQPTVGDLMALCEENYVHLLGMAPALKSLSGTYCSRRAGHMDLYLQVLEHTPYTSLLHLTYYFDHHDGQRPDPDTVLRVYHDAQQVEVQELRQHALPMERLFEAPGLLNKWRANLFISKWLTFCVQQGHQFSPCMPDVSNTGLPAAG